MKPDEDEADSELLDGTNEEDPQASQEPNSSNATNLIGMYFDCTNLHFFY